MQVSCSYTVNTVHILNIPGFVKCPGAGKKLTVKCPGAGNFFCANARGCPGGGGMVRVGIERDITRHFRKYGLFQMPKSHKTFT